MANVVILKPGESAPDYGERILIVMDASKKRARHCLARRRCYLPLGPLVFDEALRHAQTNAASFGVSTIYTQEVGDAHRP